MLPEFSQPKAEIFVPDGMPLEEALARTTHLGISAHQDDLEIMAAQGILDCQGKGGAWFTGVVVTDGGGSPREGKFADVTDEQMKEIRRQEQKKAACLGSYGAQVLLDFPSALVKDAKQPAVVHDLAALLKACKPKRVYTHNLADKHDTHVAVALRVLAACRALPADQRPAEVTGCEVWRDLDWLDDGEKVIMPVDGREDLQTALIAVFESQVAGGKRYDRAVMGRRKAHATFFTSHATDSHQGLIWGMDLTPAIREGGPSPEALAAGQIKKFETDVMARLRKFS